MFMRVVPFPVGEQSMRFLHDNFDFDVEDGTWFYAFHTDTLPIEDVKRIGVAANDALGRTFVTTLDMDF